MKKQFDLYITDALHQFKDYFFSFIEDKKSFRGIDKIFKTSFIDEKSVPLIRDNPPNSTSLGLRIQQLILEDLSHTASLIVGETINNIEYKKALIHASSEYILALEEIHETFIQKKMKWNLLISDPFHFFLLQCFS